MSVEAILQPYVDAPTLVAAEEDEYELAARLAAKALEAGCGQRLVARAMRGWYLLKSGAIGEGEAISRAARGAPRRCRGPDHTRPRGSDAGLQDAALEAFDDALAAAKRRGFSKGEELEANSRLAATPASLNVIDLLP